MREDDTLLNNLLTDCMNEVLEDQETDALFQRLQSEPIGLFSILNEENPPTSDDITKFLMEPQSLIDPKEKLYDYPPFEKELKAITELEADQILKKRLLLDNKYKNMIEYMLEDTLFNLMEEATYEEFDLC
jgi:ribosomal protein L16 Arg81 hydroxylase